MPISWVYESKKWVEFFVNKGLNPELGIDEKSLQLPKQWHIDLAKYIHDNNLSPVVHMPFFMPVPGSQNIQHQQIAIDTLKKAAEIAAIYGAEHMIGHPAFEAANHSVPPTLDRLKASQNFCPACQRVASLLLHDPVPTAGWLENSIKAWAEVLASNNINLYLENTYDLSALAVKALVLALREQFDATSRVGMCFDLGHWFCFAEGSKRNNLEAWLDDITPVLRHLHLHDNHGGHDEHLGLGQANIPLNAFFDSLVRRGLKPSFTLEPHELEAFEHSSKWMQSNRQMRNWLAFAGY